MKRKKFVKQLMAMGVQRNDAAGFVNAYRVIRSKGLPVPGLIDPPVPVIVNEREIRKMAATFTGSMEFELSTAITAEQKKEYIKGRLGNALAHALMDSGLCKVQATTDPAARAIVYRTTIEVAVPKEGGVSCETQKIC